jgi:mono/diheme cytochrome c family protein
MKIRSLLSLAAAVALAAPAAARAQAVEKLVKRGAYLVRLGGCNDCHTPWKLDPKRGPVPDMSRMLSGHSSDGPDPAGKVVPPDIGIIGPTLPASPSPSGSSTRRT